MTQPPAWAAYDQWLQDPRVELVDEPAEIEARFGRSRASVSPPRRAGRIPTSRRLRPSGS